MKTKLLTALFLLLPLFVYSQNYEKEGDDLFAQAQYEQAEKKYKAAVALVGESQTIKQKQENCIKCKSLLSKAKTAAENATTISEYKNASKLYLDLYSVHALPSYKSKAHSLQLKADNIVEQQRQAEQAERERKAKAERDRQDKLEAERLAKQKLEAERQAERERRARLEAEQRAQKEKYARLAAEQRKKEEAQRREEERLEAKKRAEEKRIAEFMQGYESIGKCAIGTYLNVSGVRVKVNNLPSKKKKVKIIKKDNNLFPITYEISVGENGIKCKKFEYTGGVLTSAIPTEVVGNLNEGYIEFSIRGECKISNNYDPELRDIVWVKIK